MRDLDSLPVIVAPSRHMTTSRSRARCLSSLRRLEVRARVGEREEHAHPWRCRNNPLDPFSAVLAVQWRSRAVPTVSSYKLETDGWRNEIPRVLCARGSASIEARRLMLPRELRTSISDLLAVGHARTDVKPQPSALPERTLARGKSKDGDLLNNDAG